MSDQRQPEPRDRIDVTYTIEIDDEWIARFYKVLQSINKNIEKLVTAQQETNKQLRRIKSDQ